MLTWQLTASDGARLAIYEHGDRERPTVLLIHGYPDDHTVWDGVTSRLATDYHVVSYDVRGAGRSRAPRNRSAYRLDQLAADLAAVVDEVSPEYPVHLLAHDWGSIQAWHAVTGERLRGRVRSFTSMSGPCLDHAGQWFRSRLRRPTPKHLAQLGKQLFHSTYIGFFQIPVLPELAWRARLLPRVIRAMEHTDPDAVDEPVRPRTADGVRGLALYRANMLPRLSRPTARHTDVPVQVIAPTSDPFVTTDAQSDITEHTPKTWVRRVPGGHWLPRTRPDVVARCAHELVDHVETGADTHRGLRQARCDGKGDVDGIADRLVLITGAGSGIGRELALSCAARGAEVLAADIYAEHAHHTAELASQLGPKATSYQVDVADPTAMAELAQRVRTEHGVVDLLVNNAGIGVTGRFSDTTLAEWREVVDVNLWGVVHGCREFTASMRQRGTGGRVVNIASEAAHRPAHDLTAYGTTKAAVVALSKNLRTELRTAEIAVTAVSPGFVHTGITTRTRFAGTGPDAERAARDTAYQVARRSGYSARYAAYEILRAVRRDRAVARVAPRTFVGRVLLRLTPRALCADRRDFPRGSR